ncbi:MAG: efflux RND transporter periplasmic adaptor subunit [Candidatus Eisenbacteria bacterium]|uniref:Efflux RND transporter periplasmic adaptor subunit n=1 Tax=Eiseniibacteriota bacterium TaxID=2212470 RepID=A0A948RYC3_UNCEI|nr:efflux RND transporter periplasmic adaptor subunit [Candidatus Eisenbacteria bacterium]MBU1948328.1 efflux RND transporter periplasmic adaptor subunit [Candidatus Eisenbacteria bacterium]MBU2692221.1 efflux RND transporter periplasmic adaptor subunit [Candidatus Eisenbacteria bacterium]
MIFQSTNSPNKTEPAQEHRSLEGMKPSPSLPLLPSVLLISFCLGVIFLSAGCGAKTGSQKDTSAIPVEILTVSPDSLTETAVLTGLLKAYRAVNVVSEVGGEITSILHDVGDRVDSNILLAVIDKTISRESLHQADAAVIAALARFEMTRNDYQRDSTLFKTGDIAAAVYDNSHLAYRAAEAELLSTKAARELAKRQLDKTDLRAPFKGTLSRRHCDVGTYIVPGQAVYRIVDIDSLRLRLGVSQNDMIQLSVGKRVLITPDALSDWTFDGKIRSVSPEADEISHTFSVEVVIPNPPGYPLRDGLVVHATLLLKEHPAAFAVPREAILKQGPETYLFVIVDSTAKRRAVGLGPLIGDRYVIESGLKNGDRVVVVGMRNLREDSEIIIEKQPRQ